MDAPPKVLILCGSRSDLPVLAATEEVLREFGVGYELRVASAHRAPARVAEACRWAEEVGVRVIVAAAGHAAHLAGVVASMTPLPVVGVPIPSSDLRGLDSLLAMVQMPGGVPVAVMAIGAAGATNAGVFAVQVLATADEGLRRRLAEYKARLALP